MSVTDDDIIKKRLLIEGDGGNDDKRICNLMRTFLRYCNSTENDEESATNYQRILATLTQSEYTIEKSCKVHQMNLKEQTNYDQLSNQIEQKIKEATEKISECKKEVQQAKRIRKNRQEYDALAKVIQQHPDRQETTSHITGQDEIIRLATTRQLQCLDKEVASLEESKETLEQKLDLRRKQFHVLIASIHELEKILEDDEKKESMDTS